jgi:UDP-N-acetylglucosamine 2-epimerase (non-hydrolysing)/GDP/UDP-N,N'-diacetylbacillosamine 2-epimerase (hydrolysing)
MRLAVLTGGNQDWGILRSTCRLLRDDSAFDLRLFAGGLHTKHGDAALREVREEGFTPAETLRWLDDTGRNAHEQSGEVLRLLGEALARHQPDALLLVGDRFETAAAALAATISRVPLIHLHGGEETEGAFDDCLRHAVTKMSHLHLVSHKEHAFRVVAMGEDADTVHVVGAPGLDNASCEDMLSRAQLEERLGMRLEPPVVIVTLHPATLGEDPRVEAEAMIAAMERVEATYVINQPNMDPGNDAIRQALAANRSRPRWRLTESLGRRGFWGLLRLADAMVGNSSSALIEAPVCQLPAVNIGARQKRRLRGQNLIDVQADADQIQSALERALSPAFRRSLQGTTSPFGDGRSAGRIREVLAGWRPPTPPIKRGVWRLL